MVPAGTHIRGVTSPDQAPSRHIPFRAKSTGHANKSPCNYHIHAMFVYTSSPLGFLSSEGLFVMWGVGCVVKVEV